MRHLIVVLGDQLDRRSAAFDGFDARVDRVWMAEVAHEATKVWSSKPRIALFLAAMRQFAAALRDEGIVVEYLALEAAGDGADTLAARLAQSIARLAPQAVLMVEPGEWSVREQLRATLESAGCACELRPDRHFLCSHEAFAEHARGLVEGGFRTVDGHSMQPHMSQA